LRDLPYAEQWIQIIGLIAAIVAGLLSRPFPLEHEADPANPALAARGKTLSLGCLPGHVDACGRRFHRIILAKLARRVYVLCLAPVLRLYEMLANRSHAAFASCLSSGILMTWLSAVYFRQRKSLILRSG
jgi:hypothetical protein